MKMDKGLLLKYIEGNCTEQEKILITEWLDSDIQNMKEYIALRKLNDISIWQTTELNVPTQKSGKSKDKIRLKTFYVEFVKIAAVFVLAFLIFSLYSHLNGEKELPIAEQSLNVPQGQRAQLTLADGTKVWLNAKSKLTFPNRFKEDTREVILDGEGYFEVTKDKAKPFIVRTSKYDVKVLGTTFDLKAYSKTEDFETSLLEGSVEILKPESSVKVLLKPNERISLQEGQLVIAPITHSDYFLWKDGILSFDDEPFPNLMKKLELVFDIEIEVKNDNVLKYSCTGKFRTKDGIEHILKVLQLANEFKYEVNSELNAITIK